MDKPNILYILADDLGWGDLVVNNAAGKLQATLGVNENGGCLHIGKKTGEPVVAVVADEYGGGELGVSDSNGYWRILRQRN